MPLAGRGTGFARRPTSSPLPLRTGSPSALFGGRRSVPPAARAATTSSPNAFRSLISRAGAAYTSLVTYLIPPIALAYGAIFLHESFGLTAFAALALILVGVALATGSVRLTSLRAARAAAREAA